MKPQNIRNGRAGSLVSGRSRYFRDLWSARGDISLSALICWRTPDVRSGAPYSFFNFLDKNVKVFIFTIFALAYPYGKNRQTAPFGLSRVT